MRHWVGNALRGACMGLSDAVPGVSGGTMALVLGIYARLVDAVSGFGPALLRRAAGGAFWRRVAQGFRDPDGLPAPGASAADDRQGADAGRVLLLASLAAGLLPALVIGSATLPTFLSRYPAPMRGLFLGLVLASVTIPARAVGRWRPALCVLAVGTALTTAWFVGLPERTTGRARGEVVLHLVQPTTADVVLTPLNLALTAEGDGAGDVVYAPAGSTTVRAGVAEVRVEVVAGMAGAAGNAPAGAVEDVARSPVPVASASQPRALTGGRDPSLAFVFLAGVLAISAMTLPGVSGAFVLLLFGLYHFVTHALKTTLSRGDPESALVVATMVAAMGVGLLTFARVLRWLFARWRAGTLAVLAGLMTGSLRKLWPFVEHAPDGREVLALPAPGDPGLIATVALFWVGGTAVLTLEAWGRMRRADSDHDAGSVVP